MLQCAGILSAEHLNIVNIYLRLLNNYKTKKNCHSLQEASAINSQSYVKSLLDKKGIFVSKETCFVLK